ncbi:restriction endonuclease subunit S [Mannheimia pernigra]|uniref:restriction endonuclease subunit S n=1 Tax=Mannheimia pernigra TaxID=111844 RepID=UPI001318CF22|nr:restriction endonuclease subunit S [Mannheimia pernigra]QHB17505.1 restriction endonuclease subunit S [Mannheimia pernigra]
MSNSIIEKLLNGAKVEWKPLGEIAEIYGGLTGKSKHDFENGNAKYITYKNIFDNIQIDENRLETVKVNSDEKQHQVKYGDVLFTGSSETADEAGMSSAVTVYFNEPVYLNSFSFGLRFFDEIKMMPEFSKFLFRSHFMRIEIAKTASGVTRFNISKARFRKILIPIPPLEIQEKIVKTLDKFTELEATLEAELALRKKQYQYYRETLLTFPQDLDRGGYNDITKALYNSGNVVFKTLGEVAEYSQTRIKFDCLNEENYVGVDNLLQNRMGKINSNYVPTSGNLTEYKENDILIGNIRPYLKKIWQANNCGGTNGDVLVIRTTDGHVNPKYLYQVLADDKFFSYNMQHAKGAKMPRGNKSVILQYQIPIPPIEEQNHIVEILDKFDRLTNSISEGLPKEIELRRKQYEYYREQLLDFPRTNLS